MKDDIMPTARMRAHSVVINARERVVITGVNDIDCFNESEVVLMTDAGVLCILGEDLHINKLNLEEGQIIIDGLIEAMEYSDDNSMRKKSFLSKIFR